MATDNKYEENHYYEDMVVHGDLTVYGMPLGSILVPQNNLSASAAPTVADDSNSGYSVGSIWLDLVADEAYRCLDSSIGAAVWLNTTLTIDELGTMALQDAIDVVISSSLIVGSAGTPDGTLHVHTGSAGAVTAHVSYDDLVVENGATGGISILTPDANSGVLAFGSATSNVGAFLNWNYNNSQLLVATKKAGASVLLQGDNGVTNLTLSGNTGSELAQFSGKVIVGSSSVSPDGTLHVHTGSAGVITAPAAADDLVVEGSTTAGISVLTPDADNSYVVLGSTSDASGLVLTWNYNNSEGEVRTAKVGASLVLSGDDNIDNLTLSGASGNELATFAGDVTLTDGQLTATTTADERVIDIALPSTATTSVLHIDNANSLISGRIAYFRSDSASASARNLVEIINDNTLATGATVLALQQDAAQRALFIDSNGDGISIEVDSEAIAADVIDVRANALGAGGKIAFLYSNSPDSGNRTLVDILNDNTAATGTTVLAVRQDAAQTALSVVQTADGKSLVIDTEHTTTFALQINADVLISGRAAHISTASSAFSGKLVNLQATSGSSTGQLLTLVNAGIGSSLDIDQNGNGTALNITHDGTSSRAIDIVANNLTNANAMRVLTNSADVSSRGVIYLYQQNSAASGAVPLWIRQESAASALFIDHNGNGISFDLDSEASTSTPFRVRAPTSGNIAQFFNEHATAPQGIYLDFSAASPDNNTQFFLRCLDSTTSRCFIYSDGDIVNHDGTYGTISDVKLKTDIIPSRSYIEDFLALRVRKYRMKSDIEQYGQNAPYRIGHVAQEVEKVFPSCVKESPDTEEVVVGTKKIPITKSVKNPNTGKTEEKVVRYETEEVKETRIKKDASGNPITTKMVKSSIIEGPIMTRVVQELILELRTLRQAVADAGITVPQADLSVLEGPVPDEIINAPQPTQPTQPVGSGTANNEELINQYLAENPQVIKFEDAVYTVNTVDYSYVLQGKIIDVAHPNFSDVITLPETQTKVVEDAREPLPEGKIYGPIYYSLKGKDTIVIGATHENDPNYTPPADL